ncbi:MAG TPA: DUF998 domain-containing protein [Candidatus Dormibacteraeota bacterium]|nr:DUF998 domain-containing protein [Candidatus Dormibacteraeota bacterium]
MSIRSAERAGATETGEAGSGLERRLLACGAIGPPLFVAVFLVEGVVHPPGYNPLRHTVSAFVFGDFGWVQRASFLVTGGLLLAFAFGLRPALGRSGYGGGRWVPALIGLFGIGLIGSGLFAADPVSSGVTASAPYPPGTPVVADRTLHGILHDLFGTPVFLGLPIACCVMAYQFARAGRKGWASYSIGTAAAYLTGFVLTSMALAQPSALLPPVGGLLQRLTIVVGWAWLTALALHLLGPARRSAGAVR